MKKILFLFLFLVILLAACSEKNAFIGKGDFWEVNYDRDEILTIKYIGNEPTPTDKINYIIEQETSKIDGNDKLNEKGILRINRPMSEKEEAINVTIKWNKKMESFQLKRQ